MERDRILSKDIKSIATVPVDRPTFLHTEGGPVRIIGFLVCCGERFEDFNFDGFATFPICENGCVWCGHDGNNGREGIFHGPIKKGGYDYKEGFGYMYTDDNETTEQDYLEYCKEIGLEIIE